MKTLFVTGGSRGIGAAVMERFRNEGYRVIAPSRNEMDLLSRESILDYFIRNRDIAADCIVNNAGINPLAPIDEISNEDLLDTLQVNLIAPVLIVRALGGAMIRQSYGRIVNIGSIWGIVSKEKRTAYSISKNGIHGLTNTLAVELSPHNILVNTVCPGYTNTELTRKNVSSTEAKEIFKNIPLGRFAEPSEIASLIYFLGSDLNTYITGQKIAIDGGFTAK